VVLYTDGVTDVPPPHHLSAERFTQLVGEAAAACSTADRIADWLHAELSDILAIDSRTDDIALLVLRVTGEA
jgi:serine phosphatase RsbU (regulator of sigma subunit)